MKQAQIVRKIKQLNRKVLVYKNDKYTKKVLTARVMRNIARPWWGFKPLTINIGRE